MKEIILATSNFGKIAEFQSMLAPIRCIAQSTLGINSAEETGLSFIENALLKARHASHLSRRPALADDSGLVVPALGGKPGIYSARFAGNHASDKENSEYLLNQLSQMKERTAYFYCALVFVRDPEDPTPIFATGKWIGEISLHAQGNHGFGYDPIFYLPDYTSTAAELPEAIKNTISHRALALKELREKLMDEYANDD